MAYGIAYFHIVVYYRISLKALLYPKRGKDRNKVSEKISQINLFSYLEVNNIDVDFHGIVEAENESSMSGIIVLTRQG